MSQQTTIGMMIRLNAAKKPRVLDLFAGCGGLSLGFRLAGFEISGALDIDPFAAASHAENFHQTVQPRLREIHAKPRDIEGTKPEALFSELELDTRMRRAVDIVIGGPPCQPFTRVGRAKLREIAGRLAAHVHDGRVTLYEHYLRFIEEVRPLAFVMENVPDIGRFAGRNIAEEIAITAEEIGYETRYALLNAVWYGVPQMRERVFIVGLQKELGQIPVFPAKTHVLTLPKGYITSRVGSGVFPFLTPHDHYTCEVDEVVNPSPAITARAALSDLPPIREHLEHMQARRGRRTFSNRVLYLKEPENGYQRLMRNCPGFEGSAPPSDHVTRYTPRDYETFRRMKPGDQYPQAFKIALTRLMEAVRIEGEKTGHLPEMHSPRYEELRKSIVPPYDPLKFPNKWRKMEPDSPARTIPAHIGKDSYSHIHYDSAQARMISVREAARLQSFPDGFRFYGSMNHAFRQIGNSVPPLLSYYIAMCLRRQLLAAGKLTDIFSQC